MLGVFLVLNVHALQDAWVTLSSPSSKAHEVGCLFNSRVSICLANRAPFPLLTSTPLQSTKNFMLCRVLDGLVFENFVLQDLFPRQHPQHYTVQLHNGIFLMVLSCCSDKGSPQQWKAAPWLRCHSSRLNHGGVGIEMKSKMPTYKMHFGLCLMLLWYWSKNNDQTQRTEEPQVFPWKLWSYLYKKIIYRVSR